MKNEQKIKKTEQVLLKFTSEELKEIEDILELFSRSEYESRSIFIRAALFYGITALKKNKLTQMETTEVENE